MDSVIRKATAADLCAVAEIYKSIHHLEESGTVSIGWDSRVYPVYDTASDALGEDSLFVMTIDDKVVASAIINQKQPSVYYSVEWLNPVQDDKVGVLHTLVVHPDFGKQGLGRLFIQFFENYCKRQGYEVVRLDTQVKNTRAYSLYPKLGYRLAGIRRTKFQNLPAFIDLAMFEKKI